MTTISIEFSDDVAAEALLDGFAKAQGYSAVSEPRVDGSQSANPQSRAEFIGEQLLGFLKDAAIEHEVALANSALREDIGARRTKVDDFMSAADPTVRVITR